MNSLGNVASLKKILKLFENTYRDIYRQIKAYNKSRLLDYSSAAYRKWYYSALIDGTIFSPANIFNSQTRKKNTVIAPVASPVTNGKTFTGFEFKLIEYTTTKHPFIGDLNILLEHFNPDAIVDNNGMLEPSAVKEIMQSLTYKEPFYVEYLTVMAYKLKLIKKLLSIHSHKAQLSENVSEFTALSADKKLVKVFEAAIEIAAEQLSYTMPNGTSIFNVGFIRTLLDKPITADDIFENIYKKLGINISGIMEKHADTDDELTPIEDEFEAAIVSSTFFLGSALDQWFLTPFGQYLQIIQPFYYFTYNYTNELYFLIDTINSNGDLLTSLFSPCTFYLITPLGAKILKTKDKSMEAPIFPKGIEMEQLIEKIFDEMMLKNLEAFNEKTHNTPNVFEVKVKLSADKRCWKVLEVPVDLTLHNFHNVLAYAFKYEPMIKYSFFTSETPSPFCEFTAPWAEGRTKKADTATLDELINVDDKITYTTNSVYNFEITFLKHKSGIVDVSYPRIIHKSKQMEAAESQNEI